MPSRRLFLSAAAGGLCVAAEPRFSKTLGLQLYSLRRDAANNLPQTLGQIRKLGFREVEVGDLHGRTAAEFRQLLSSNGLNATSMGADWEELSTSINQVADRARSLGVQHVTTSQIPRKSHLKFEDAKQASETLNRWGESLATSGLRLCYHIHGYEFVPGPDGTLFDTLAKRMDPRLVNFEMDVFWVVFGNADPVKLLGRYSGRFPLMHLKDIRKGEKRTFDPGTVAEEASVPLGQGEVVWPPLLVAAQKHGVRHYYLEEEHPDTVAQIRQSLRYLERVRF